MMPHPGRLRDGWLTFLCLVIGWTIPGIAKADELKLLSSEERSGSLLRLNQQSLTFKTDEGEQTYPLAQVLWVDLQAAPKPISPATTFHRLTLVDGSQLIGREIKLQGKVAQVKGMDDQIHLVPLTQVAHVLWEAQDADNVREWSASAARAAKTDLLRLVSRDGKSINLFEGVLGKVDEEGQNIQFQLDGGDPRPIALSRVRSLSYTHSKSSLPPIHARLAVVQHHQFMLTRFEWSAEALTGETASGLHIKVEPKQIHRLDFSLGKLVYLSDLEPLRKEFTPIHADHLPRDFDYGRDKNRMGGPLTLGRKVYAKGLGLHSRAMLEYDVADYQIFRSVIGIDGSMTSMPQPMGHALVRIEGDNKELFRTVVSAQDAKPVEVELKITGVKRLRLIVDYGEDHDLGDHVNFADARILK